jgi:hypothetical protein
MESRNFRIAPMLSLLAGVVFPSSMKPRSSRQPITLQITTKLRPTSTSVRTCQLIQPRVTSAS